MENMKLQKRIAPLISAAAICFFISAASAQTPLQLPAPSPLIAAGSGANLEITRLLANAFMKYHPRVTIEVPGSIGSKGAITAVADNEITFQDLADIYRGTKTRWKDGNEIIVLS